MRLIPPPDIFGCWEQSGVKQTISLANAGFSSDEVKGLIPKGAESLGLEETQTRAKTGTRANTSMQEKPEKN